MCFPYVTLNEWFLLPITERRFATPRSVIHFNAYASTVLTIVFQVIIESTLFSVCRQYYLEDSDDGVLLNKTHLMPNS